MKVCSIERSRLAARLDELQQDQRCYDCLSMRGPRPKIGDFCVQQTPDKNEMRRRGAKEDTASSILWWLAPTAVATSETYCLRWKPGGPNDLTLANRVMSHTDPAVTFGWVITVSPVRKPRPV
jgi:hypothetical protein